VNQLKTLIDLFHLYDIAVLMDVVYNHLGGEFDEQSIRLIDFHATEEKPYGPYFQNAGYAGGLVPDYQSAPVRRFFIENVRAMAEEYRIDGVRYDEVTVIDEHGGWAFCQELTTELDASVPHLLNVAEYWRGDKSWVLRDRSHGGAGFGAVWLDTVRDAIRDAIASAARGRSAFVDMTRVGRELSPTFGDDPGRFWRVVHCIENHDLHKAGNDDRKPRIAALADPSDSRSWYACSRSQVASALLLAAPGIPMIFMGQEILEDKYWSDNPGQYPNTLVWWDGLQQQRPMQEHLRFMRDFLRLRRERPGLSGRYSKAYQLHDIDRVLLLLRGTGNGDDDIVVVASLNESTLRSYEIGLPHSGTWYELLNGNAYDFTTHELVGNGGSVEASGPPHHGMPASARITIPANGVLVLGRLPSEPPQNTGPLLR
jgi:1,4-alpha-glucan branching enzyme